MIHIYMDDLRKVPKGFTLARSTEECLLMLREREVDILSMDYDKLRDIAEETDLK